MLAQRMVLFHQKSPVCVNSHSFCEECACWYRFFLPHPRHLIPVMIECLCVVYVTDIQSPQGVSPPFAQSSGSGKALAPA